MSDIGYISQLAAAPTSRQVRSANTVATNADREVRNEKSAAGVASEENRPGAVIRQVVEPAEKSGGPSETSEKLSEFAEFLESFIPDLAPNTRLRIDKDEDAGRFVYLNVDNESGEVVKQFPPEDLLEFIKQFREAAGLLVDSKA